MNFFIPCILVGSLGAFASQPEGRLMMVSTGDTIRVFAGPARSFQVVWQNGDTRPLAADVGIRLLQASSTTTVKISEWPWKRLQVLPGQTILEQVAVDFPEVKAESRFIVQWTEFSGGTNQDSSLDSTRVGMGGTPTLRVLGTKQVLVYPTNLLAELGPLAGKDRPVGLFDPGNQILSLLEPLGVSSDNLTDDRIADYRGNLAIMGPFKSREEMPASMLEKVHKLARSGMGIVWFLPPPAPHAKTLPSYYTVQVGAGRVVVAQSWLVSGLATDPQAQMNLLHLCRCARHPVSLALPGLGDPSAAGAVDAAE